MAAEVNGGAVASAFYSSSVRSSSSFFQAPPASAFALPIMSAIFALSKGIALVSLASKTTRKYAIGQAAAYKQMTLSSCVACERGWSGSDCEFIDCGANGTPLSAIECECDRPYSGANCDQLNTNDVYLYYNRLVTGKCSLLQISKIWCHSTRHLTLISKI